MTDRARTGGGATSVGLVRRRVVGVFGTLVLLMLAACGGEPGGTPAEEAGGSDDPAVALELASGDRCVEGRRLRAIVENRGDSPITYGTSYRLERLEEGKWVPVELDLAFALVAIVLEPERRKAEELLLPPDLEPGRYRVSKSFTPAGGAHAPEGPPTTARAEFTIC